jgi:DNA-binding NarL/FixJ family response regulator
VRSTTPNIITSPCARVLPGSSRRASRHASLIEAVRAAAAGRLVFERRVDSQPPVLTPREAEVVRLVADGPTNEEVGHALGVTSKTVEAHLSRVFERTGIQSRTELATRAIREAWLDLPVV